MAVGLVWRHDSRWQLVEVAKIGGRSRLWDGVFLRIRLLMGFETFVFVVFSLSVAHLAWQVGALVLCGFWGLLFHCADVVCWLRVHVWLGEA